MERSLAERDRQVIWHPFTPQLPYQAPVAIVKGRGAYLLAEDGTEYLDGMSSWWVNLHGHSHPYIAAKVAEQVAQLEHSIFAQFTHEPGIALAEKLIEKLGAGFSKVFYSDNGSTSVEVAIKMCLQYWYNSEQPRTKVIAFEDAYHGDTFGSMAVGARSVFSEPFDPLLFEVFRLPSPSAHSPQSILKAFEELLKTQGKNVACMILEPLVQGAGGMLMYPKELLDDLLTIARQNQVLTIADEVMTGFGRTGKWFAFQHTRQVPDVICLSKGLTGGFMPLGATICSDEIYRAYVSSDRFKTFFHGHSYTGNPTACAAALASMDLMEKEQTWQDIERIGSKHLEFKYKYEGHPRLKDIRCCGTILAMEWSTDDDTSYLNSIGPVLNVFFLEAGIILRPLGNVLYVLPPYCISNSELDRIYQRIEEALEKF